jgi:hypothetical protein
MFYFYLKVSIIIIETITNFDLVNWHNKSSYKFIMLFLSLIILENEVKKVFKYKKIEKK